MTNFCQLYDRLSGVLPVEPLFEASAVSARNAVVRLFTAAGVQCQQWRSMPGESNPYEKIQRVRLTLYKITVEQAKAALLQDGWKQMAPSEYSTNENSLSKDDNQVSIYPRDSGQDVDVHVFGPKKSKARTLPYYD